MQDPTGAAIAAAKVQLINEATKATFSTQTSDAGAYVFEAIQSGSYTLAVEAAGFKKFSSRSNLVAIGQPTTVNVSLQVGDLTQQVEVSATAEVVQTSTSGNFGNLITGREIRDMPIVGTRGRNPVNLVFLQPGVVSGANTGGGSHVHGARDRAWNYTLDGIDVNESSSGGSETTPTKMNPDSLAEFRVITSNFTADSGRNSGAQVAMITRSGSNDFHGTLFEFYRTPSINANEWENNLDNIGKRQFVQHIFGGSIGGRILRDKTFFFANGQGLRALETRPVTRTVYTQQARQGILRYVKGGRNVSAGAPNAAVDFSGNVLPGVNIGTYGVAAGDPQRIGLDPTTQAAIKDTPLPNRFDFGDGLNTAGYIFNAAQTEEQRDVTLKIDHILDTRNTFFARLYFGGQDSLCDRVNGGQEMFPGAPCLVNTFRKPKNFAVNWRFNPTPHVTNELVTGLNKFDYNFNMPGSLDRVTLNGPVDTLAQYYFGNQRNLQTWQLVDNVGYFRGAHAVKFGLNMRFQKHQDIRGSVAGLNSNQDVNFSTGVNTVDPATFGIPSDLNTTFDRPVFQSHINFLLGRVGTTTKAFVAAGDKFAPGLYNFTANYNEYDFYVQDTWKARKNLTVDLGLRWEPKMAPTDPDGRISRPDRPVTAAGPASNTLRWVRGSLFDSSWNNLAPSIGFAWDPTGDGKTSIRSNYRIAFDRLNTFVLSSSVFQSMPGAAIGITDNDFGQGGGRLANLPKLQPPSQKPADLTQPAPFSNNSNTVLDPSFKFPTTHQWAFSLQREVLKNTVLEVSYIGRRAYHLIGAYNANQSDIFRNGFLDAFKTVKAGGESALINKMLTADSRLRAGETGSQMMRRLSSSTLDLNSVAALASSIATRIQGGRSVTDLSGAGAFPIILYPQYSNGLNVIDSSDFSTYHGLILQIQRRFHNGLSFQGSWTWSKSLDTRSFDPAFTVVSSGAGQSASSSPFDMYNRKLNYAVSDFDRTHALQANWVYEFPFGKGRKWLAGTHPVLDRVVGGWELAGFFVAYTGRPFTVYSGSNTFSSVVQSPANCTGCPRSLGAVFDDAGTGFKWYFNNAERAQFGPVGAGELGNAGRNYFRGDRWFNTDMSLLKRIRFNERMNLELRADATNVTNTPSFGFPTTTVTSTLFGRIRNTVSSTSRKVQLGVKLNF
ncbi:MAG: TonB-dependent receptor [Acidobacteria bacterium]|nr:TonB-dependent receptor [Acidobacteriota bacterium]